MALLSVDNLATYFYTRNGVVRAVDGVSFELEPGETLGIVGESGSGKSVSCYSLMGLIPMPPGKIVSGTAMLDGIDLLKASKQQLRSVRGSKVSMIFQDPMTCLNPYLKIGRQVMEPLLEEGVDKKVAYERALKALDDVGILDPDKRMKQYPHEFSGGMRQRVMIAMALVTEPDLLIADEPTTALDVTVQAQILKLIADLKERKNTAVMFITHDLGVIAGIADRVNVMYAGKIVERGNTAEIFKQPSHPYTQALLDSIPSTHARGERLFNIKGLPPNLTQEISGCAFAPRCKHAADACYAIDTSLRSVSESHTSACPRVVGGEI